MKPGLLYFCAFFILCLHSSCLDIIEKLSLNKDGSGHYSIRVDAGSGFSTFSQFGENLQNQLEMPDEEYLAVDRAYDSIFYFKDFPEEQKANWKYREILEQGYRLEHVNDKKSEDWYELHLDFKNLTEIDLFLAGYKQHIFDEYELSPREQIEEETDEVVGENEEKEEKETYELDQQFLDLIWFPRKFSLNGNALTRPGHDLASFKQLSKRDQNMKLALAKKINMSLIIELPGKVKSNSNVDFETKGKRTQLEVRLDEILEEKISYDTVIEFK